jgi:hypothetical protein
VPARRSATSRLFDFFHTHRYGRALEVAFFSAIGLLLIAGAWAWNRRGGLSEPLMWLVILVGACFIVFALLPQRKAAAPPPVPKGKRGVIAAQVKASKAEKRKGPPPPIH